MLKIACLQVCCVLLAFKSAVHCLSSGLLYIALPSGLLCLSTAKEGGLTSWSSSGSIYNRLLQSHPDYVKVCIGNLLHCIVTAKIKVLLVKAVPACNLCCRDLSCSPEDQCLNEPQNYTATALLDCFICHRQATQQCSDFFWARVPCLFCPLQGKPFARSEHSWHCGSKIW